MSAQIPIANALDTIPEATISSSAAALSSVARPLALGYAGRWKLWVKPTGADLTTVRYRTRGRTDWPWSDWVTATGVAPGDGVAGTIAVDGDCSLQLDVELTADGDGTAALYLVGV